jgi:hypothetical protein
VSDITATSKGQSKNYKKRRKKRQQQRLGKPTGPL